VDPVNWPDDENQALFDVNLWLDPYGKFISRTSLNGVMWIVQKKPRLVSSHDIHEILFSLREQDCQKLVRKCDTIPLLDRVNRVWNPWEREFFQSQTFAKNSQAPGLCHPEVSCNEFTSQKQTLFKHSGNSGS
jgi:hypothetical protein